MSDERAQKTSDNKVVWITAIAMLLIGGAGWWWISGAEPGSSVSQAFCADLDSGYTMMNLWPRDMDPEEFATKAWGYVATTCPEYYAPYRDYFDGWGKPEIKP